MKTLCVFADGSTEAHEIEPAAEVFVCLRRERSVTTLPGFWRGEILNDSHAHVFMSRYRLFPFGVGGTYSPWFFAENGRAVRHLLNQIAAVRALAALISGLRGTLVG